jgi:hypothetical protein
MSCKWPHRCVCVADIPNLHHWLNYVCSRDSTTEEVDDCYVAIVCVLSCMLHNNPNANIREKAAIELLHPVYNEARRRYGENLDEPDRRRLG